MAPKKSRVQRDSEPPAEAPARATRGRKRRQSDASNVSVQSAGVQPDVVAGTPSKRRKQKQTVVEPMAGLEEHDEIVGDVDIKQIMTDIDLPTQSHEIVAVQTTQNSSRGVHFDEVESDNEIHRTTAAHITPHPRKTFSLRRRTTASSTSTPSYAKRVEVKTSRQSLPSALAQDEVKEYEIEEMTLQYAPYQEVLRPRMERLARIEALGAEYQAKQLAGDKEGALLVRDELLLLMPGQTGTAIDVDEYLDAVGRGDGLSVLASQEITYPRLQIEDRVDESLSMSQIRDRPLRTESFPEVERRKLQDAILSLSAQAESAREERRLLEEELLGLGLAADTVQDPSTALVSIRQTFREIREELEEVLPGEADDSWSNVDVVRLLMSDVKSFAGRLRQQDKVIQDRTGIIGDLKSQIEGLLDLLAASKTQEERLADELNVLELRTKSLSKTCSDLDRSNEGKERDNEDLLEQVHVLEEERDDLDSKLQLKVKENKRFYDENLEYARNIVRLNDSLKDYQEEKTRLEHIVVQVEEDRDQRQRAIDELQGHMQALNADLDDTKAQLVQLTRLYEEETAARSTADADLKEKYEEISDLESRVQNLEQELETHAADLEELRNVNIAERKQREDAEAELDKRDEDIESLNEKLEARGLEANQLRQKLFEIQQGAKVQVEKLETDAAARDEQYQKDIAAEVARREAEEDLAARQQEVIVLHEQRIATLEIGMTDALAQRDGEIEALKLEVIDYRNEITRLEAARDNANAAADTNAYEREQLQEQLDTTIENLQSTIAMHVNTIAAMEKEAVDIASLHTSEIEDFQQRVAELNDHQEQSRIQIQQLETDVAGLEKRIEHEARETLTIQAQKDADIKELEQAIIDRDEKMLFVIEEAKDSEGNWRAQVAERDEEIEVLRASGQTQEKAVLTLETSLQSMKLKFSEYVRRSQERFVELQNALAAAKALADTRGSEHDRDSARVLEDIESMEVVSKVAVATTSVSTQEPKFVVKKSRGNKKKRVQDSGYYETEAEENMAI